MTIIRFLIHHRVVKLFFQAAVSVLIALSFSTVRANGFLATIQQAQNNDTGWESQKLGVSAQRQQLNRVKAALLPTISVGAQYSDSTTEIDGFNRGTNTTETTEIEQAATNYTATLTQTLYRGDQWYAWRAAKVFDQQLNLELSIAEQAFWIRIAGEYYDILKAGAELAFREAEKAAIARQLEQTEQRFEVGLIAITDLHEAKALYDLSAADLLLASNDLQIARGILATSSGQRQEQLNSVAADFSPNTPQNGLEHWLEVAIESGPQVKLARINREFAQLQRKAQRMAFGPTLDLIASYLKGPTAPSSAFDGDISNRTISLQFNLPLYTGGRQRANYNEAKLNFQQRSTGLTNSIKLTRLAVANQYSRLSTDALRVGARKQAILSASSALDATQAGYDVGTRNIVDLLDAQRRLFSAKRDLAFTQLDYLLNYLTFHQTLGSLDSSILEQVDGWMRSTKTFRDEGGIPSETAL